MKRILITGGAGFIGSHLCDALIQKKHHVICLDNFFTGTKNNIAHLLKNPNFELIEHDIVLPINLSIDEIYNLACPASPIHYQINPINTTKTSVLGVLNMLELAQAQKAKILHASTSEVYGDPTIHPQSEKYWGNVNPIGLRACYNEGKRVAETLLFDYHRTHNVDIRLIRIFNTYGPRMAINDGRVVSNFIVQALKGEDISVYGDGTQTRSFCYVDDLVTGMIKMMENKINFYGPANLGNPHELTIIELANQVLALTQSKSQITFKPLPEDDPKIRRPDVALIQDKINWRAMCSFENGLQNTIAYFKSILETA
jgi:UDP-glucuronate decarboxylase